VRAFFQYHFQSKKYSETLFNERLESFEKLLKQCYCEYPDQEYLIECLLEMNSPEELAQKLKITTFVPCKPMLAKPTKEISIIFKRFEGMKFTCEYKYDGLRGQIHYNEGKCQVTYIEI